MERRGTFVGTAFYVSPEMLNDNQACPESDLWALGCIVYQMFSGEVPFSGATDYATFQKILAREVAFPESIPVDARDLIDKLL